jgi:hypothetical protein
VFVLEIATVPTGLAVKAPENVDPSDIDTDTTATVVPATELSGRDATVETKLMPVGVGGGETTATTVMVKSAELLNRVYIPFARTLTE